jgi:hypothetical protein
LISNKFLLKEEHEHWSSATGRTKPLFREGLLLPREGLCDGRRLLCGSRYELSPLLSTCPTVLICGCTWRPSARSDFGAASGLPVEGGFFLSGR